MTASVSELLQACSVLFYPDFNYSVDFIKSLDSSALKVAYRKKALATHPDRAAMLGRNRNYLSRKFVEVTRAYDILCPVVSKAVTIDLTQNHTPFTRRRWATGTNQTRSTYSQPDNGFCDGTFRKKQKPSDTFHRERQGNDRYYTGSMPQHRLLLGQFLYFSGVITWKTLIDAIVWQKNQGLLFGEIAKQWAMMTDSDIREILRNRPYPEKMGDYAIRQGYITPFQRLAILGKQSMLRRRIGAFFIDKALLTERQLDQALENVFRHNLQF